MLEIDESWYVRPVGVRDHTSAGGVVVRVEAGEVLVALARDEEAPTHVLPKGTLEPGESIEAAARREIAEEAGFTRLTKLADLGACERLTIGKDVWLTAHYFLYLTAEIDVQPTDPAHPDPPAWYRLDALPPMFWPEQRRLIEQNLDRIRTLALAAGRH